MKQIKLNNISERINLKKVKIIAIAVAVIVVLVALLICVEKVNAWYDKHFIQFNAPVEMKFNYPIEIKQRLPIIQKIVLDYPDEIDTPIKKYICDKFGPYDCKVALSIVKAESNFNDQALHANSNGSVDLGCWQINFPSHAGQISPKDTLDCYKATDFAYQLFQQQGFRPWTTYNNDSYLLFVKP
jgi:hypothetical protein